MYILLILFFASLASIIVMIGRKLVLLQNGQVSSNKETVFEVSHLEKVKHFTITNIKKYEHLILVEVLRFYVRGTNLFKNKYEEIKIKIRNIKMKRHISGEKKEISKLLKIIGEYKSRIKEIKHKIRKEEDL